LQFLHCEFLRIRIAAVLQNRSRGKHLDKVHAVISQQADFLAYLPRAVCFAVVQIPR